MAQGYPGGYSPPAGGSGQAPLEFALCEFCGRELPARMLDTHKNRVHNVPLPKPAPRPPGMPDPSIPPWISDQGSSRTPHAAPRQPRFPPSAATAFAPAQRPPPASPGVTSPAATPPVPAGAKAAGPVGAPPLPDTSVPPSPSDVPLTALLSGQSPPPHGHALPPPPPDWVRPGESKTSERQADLADDAPAPAEVEERPVAPTPPVLTEDGPVPPEGEPAPVPEATPDQVPAIVAEATSSSSVDDSETQASPEPEAESVTASSDDDLAPGDAPDSAATSVPGEVPPHEHEVAEHEHELPEHSHELPEHQHPAVEHEHELPEHEHPLPEHEHEVAEHEHEMPEHQHELPEHEHEVGEHEHELPPHDHEDYKGLIDTQGADLDAVKQLVQDLTDRLSQRDQEIARLKQSVDDSEKVREALMNEVALARADREKQTQSLPVVVYDADEKRVASVNLFASGHGEALEKLVGAMIHSWQNEGKAVDVTGLPPHMAVKVRDDPQGRGFELFPSSVLFLKVTSKEREALGSLPPLVSQPERGTAAQSAPPPPPPPPPASPSPAEPTSPPQRDRRPGESRIR